MKEYEVLDYETLPGEAVKFNEMNMTSNVIGKEEFRKRTEAVFADIANKLKCTFGPYGGDTIIEKGGDVSFSKDGHHVLKRFAYEDNIMNTILKLLFKIASQVNVKAGDGTTTSTVGAYYLYREIHNVAKRTNLRPKDLLDAINKVVEDICVKLQENAIQIDKDGDLEEIYKMAMVSTNGRQEIAEMIQHIYKVTGNPVIEYNKSKSIDSSYEIVDGYKMKFMHYIDNIFKNNDEGTCILQKPAVLMFNHKIQVEYLNTIIRPSLDNAIQQGRRLVIIAPFFDNGLLNQIRNTLLQELKATGKTTTVYVRATLMNNHYQDLFGDFAALLGCTVIDERSAYEFCMEDSEQEYKPEDYLGTVEEMIVGKDHTYIKGFCNANNDLLDILKQDAISKFKEIEESTERATHITEAYIDKKERIAKLECKMGIINVGGTTELAKEANFDLVEDAVKACECSYLYGYVPGQTIGIQTAIQQLIKEERPAHEIEIMKAISEAFTCVTRVLLENKFESVSLDLVKQMVEECVKGQEVIDINLTEQLEDGMFNVAYTNVVINSCKTDIEVLRAAAGIIGLLLNSNQYVTLRLQM